MKLNAVNIVTTNLIEMRDFYALVLQSPWREIVPGRFEVSVGSVTIAITPTKVKTPVNPDSCGLEFTVEDVDAEYRRLLSSGVRMENPPVTYPWKWRAIGFKDPDGNHIDFFTYVGE